MNDVSKKTKFPEIRFGHWLLIDGTKNPPTCVCQDCHQSWPSFKDVPNEDCPAKKSQATEKRGKR